MLSSPSSIRRWLLAAPIAATVACHAAAAPPEPQARPVQTALVTRAEGPQGVRYSATLAPVEQVPLAFKATGYVDALLQTRGPDRRLRDVQQGDFVGRGAVLARVRADDYGAQVHQAESRVAEAEASLAKARLDLDRADRLFASKSLTKPDLDAARLAHDGGEARLSGARADLDRARIALRDTALVAPLAAVVLERRVERGALASPGVVAFTLGDVRSIKAMFGVPDSLVRRLVPGAPLAITTDSAPGREFNGRISTVSPSADVQTRVFNVEVTVPNADGALKPGMIATVRIDPPSTGEATPDGPAVPLASIVKREGAADNYAVFVVETAGNRQVARARAITLGAVAGNAIVVTSGVQVGERIVTTGATHVRDGDAVRVIP